MVGWLYVHGAPRRHRAVRAFERRSEDARGAGPSRAGRPKGNRVGQGDGPCDRDGLLPDVRSSQADVRCEDPYTMVLLQLSLDHISQGILEKERQIRL